MSSSSYPPSLRTGQGELEPSPPNHPSNTPPLPIDSGVGLYQPPFYGYQQPQHTVHHSQLSLEGSQSSPSSGGSEYVGATPPADMIAPRRGPNVNGKRPGPSVAQGGSGSRKRPRQDEEDESASPVAEKEEVGKPKSTRGSRACTVCRRLKMKCVGAEQGPPCKRCQAGNHECIFEESNRGKRSSKKTEMLTRSLRKMEKTLDTVLRSISNPGMTSVMSGMVSRSPSPSAQSATTQALMGNSPPSASTTLRLGQASPKLHSLPDNALNPLGLLAEASLANRRAHWGSNGQLTSATASQGDLNAVKLSVANDNYFKPGPMTILPLRRLYIERQVQPEMLSFVTTEEVVDLFKIFFDHINLHCGLLDPEFHTPSLVCSRSPFLLTTICAIASKYYPSRPDLYPRLAQLAKSLAFSVPARGYKSVEIVQAYLLLTWWGINPVERYEHDQTWLLLGMGIRMATDLNLHRKTGISIHDTMEAQVRDQEVHNRERTWMACFILDRSFSAQMGKPHSIREDFIIRNADSWWRAPISQPIDSGIAAYVELQRILSRTLDFLYSGTSSSSGLQTECDYLLITKTVETQLNAWQHSWMSYNDDTDPGLPYRQLIGQFYFHYAMLVVNSFGLQNALERSPLDVAHFFSRCHSAASSCAVIVRDKLGPQGYLKYSPDSHFVQCSYAVLTLLKLVRPEFQQYLDNERKTIALVKDIADVFEKIAVGPSHTPALYSTFLRALVAAKVDSTMQPSANDQVSTITPSQSSLNFGQGSLKYPLSNAAGPPENSSLFSLNEISFAGEMGPVADISTFPPTMAPTPNMDDMGMLSMDSILSNNFWDSVLVPGFSNSFEGLSGGTVYGIGGSGIITPRFGGTPLASGANTPRSAHPVNDMHQSLDAGIDLSQRVGSS